MKNLTNYTQCKISKSVPGAVLFIFAAAIISILVITISGLVLKELYAKVSKSRADVLFTTLSVSDIGVGVLRIPFSVLFTACQSFVKCITSVLFLSIATGIFPFFSYFVTVIIAIDRLLIIRKSYSYTEFVTIGRLKGIVAFCFVFTIAYAFLYCYGFFILQLSIMPIFALVYLCALIFLPLICIATYTYLLLYVYRRANNMSHCKVVGRDNSRRLCKTIMLILVFQFILNIPGSLIIILYNLGIFPYCSVLPWLDLIWFNQNYVNGVIFLINHRKIEKRWTQNLRISIWRIFMIIWLIHSNTNNTHLKFSIIIEIHVKSSKNNHKPIWKFSSI